MCVCAYACGKVHVMFMCVTFSLCAMCCAVSYVRSVFVVYVCVMYLLSVFLCIGLYKVVCVQYPAVWCVCVWLCCVNHM